ncbi:MAG: hypothetical protein AB7S71_24445 [Dongiaceae bacterium]
MSAQKFEFAIVAEGLDPDADDFEDRLFDAGCSDALVSVIKGSIVLDFTREGKNFAHAVTSAIRDVKAAGAEVVRIEPDTYVNLSDIAARTGLTRQAVSLLIQGERGPGGFPPPIVRVTTDSPLWDWLSVARWMVRHGRLADSNVLTEAAMIRELNGILQAQRVHQAGGEILERALDPDEQPVPA